jgi:hypothetical protein
MRLPIKIFSSFRYLPSPVISGVHVQIDRARQFATQSVRSSVDLSDAVEIELDIQPVAHGHAALSRGLVLLLIGSSERFICQSVRQRVINFDLRHASDFIDEYRETYPSHNVVSARILGIGGRTKWLSVQRDGSGVRDRPQRIRPPGW